MVRFLNIQAQDTGFAISCSMLLENSVVIELASVLAGPSVGMWLAELGARVIKVEHHVKGGDVTRSWRLASESEADDRSAYFSSVNWGKESIGVDLRDPAGKQVVYDLIAKADIVIASYKPGDAAKLGMDADALLKRHPHLIYADLSAYGGDDERVGFDAIIQAEAGFTYMNGSPGGDPVKMPVALMDLMAAHQLKEGILMALLSKERTGKGRHVQTSLLGAGLASLANQATNWLVAGHVPQRMGSDHPNIVPYGTVFYARNQQGLVLAVGNDRQFAGLCEALEKPEWSSDVRFSTPKARVTHREVLKSLLNQAIGDWERPALLQVLRRLKVPAGAVMDMEAALSQPTAQRLLLEAGGFRGLKSIALEGVEQVTNLSPPPQLGADSHTILHDMLGYAPALITELKASGTVG